MLSLKGNNASVMSALVKLIGVFTPWQCSAESASSPVSLKAELKLRGLSFVGSDSTVGGGDGVLVFGFSAADEESSLGKPSGCSIC
jgi:hypothetical protein